MIPLSKPFIGDEEKQAVLRVLDAGMLVQGSQTTLLEEKFARLVGTRYAVAVSSGTAALHLALLAHGIGPGDEVITTPFTFIASVNCILYVGAKPVFVDIEADTFNLDPAQIQAAITPRTRAILPVHLYGYPCNMDAILSIARNHNLLVVEDAAQAIGAEYRGKRVGSFGTGCFSLYATKNVMSGEGGIITTDDAELAERCRMLRNHGMRRRYYHDIVGYNLRMSDLHAAIGVAQLDRLEEFTAIRRANAAYLSSHIQGAITPQVRPGYDHVWHQYTIRVPAGWYPIPTGRCPMRGDRDAAVEKLNDAGVGTGIFYPLTANRQAHIIAMGLGEARVPVAEQMAREVISIPVHPQLSSKDLERIVAAVNELPFQDAAPPKVATRSLRDGAQSPRDASR